MIELAKVILKVGSILLTLQGTVVFAQSTFRVSTPIIPNDSYWVYVKLSQPSFPVSFEATDLGGNEATAIKSTYFNPRKIEKRSEQLHSLPDLPSYGDNTTYVRLRIPENEGRTDPTIVEHVSLSTHKQFKVGVHFDDSYAQREATRRLVSRVGVRAN